MEMELIFINAFNGQMELAYLVKAMVFVTTSGLKTIGML
jgi:hypothetical protein